MKKLLIRFSIILVVYLFSINNASAATTTFKDVPESYYAYQEISYLTEKGIVKGVTATEFMPEKAVTRAEFATLVARALNLPAASSNFKDVPKTSSLYDGVSRAYKSGITKGFADGTFKGTRGVTREDMAVMLDRALQKKGNFNKSVSLPYADSKTIGGYAVNSVKKMAAYGIITQYKNNQFEGKVVGTRAETARFIYRTLKVIEDGYYGNDNSSNLTVEEIKRKAPLDLTLNEIKKAYGKQEIVERWDQFGKIEGFATRDLWEKYYKEIRYPYWKNRSEGIPAPVEWLEGFKKSLFNELINEYKLNYPNYEIISYNGTPLWESEIMTPEAEKYLARERDVFPKPPTEANKFKIDIHINKQDFATYYKGKAETAKLKQLSYTKDNKALMVDVKTAFEDVPKVNVTNTAASYGGTTVEFKVGSKQINVDGTTIDLPVVVEKKNNQIMVPIRDFASALGLYTRVTTTNVNRIEISNFEESLGQYYK